MLELSYIFIIDTSNECIQSVYLRFMWDMYNISISEIKCYLSIYWGSINWVENLKRIKTNSNIHSTFTTNFAPNISHMFEKN